MADIVGPPQAVVDTGFWNTCCRLGIHVYLTHIWPAPVLIPGAVIAEIFHQPAFMTTLNAASWASWGPLYRDQAEFLNAFLQRTLQPSNPNLSRVALFHPGERAVLDLSQQVSANALHDEQKAHDYAIAQGLDAISVPEYPVILLQEGILTVTQGVGIFQQLESLNRSPQLFVEWARTRVRRLGGNV